MERYLEVLKVFSEKLLKEPQDSLKKSWDKFLKDFRSEIPTGNP